MKILSRQLGISYLGALIILSLSAGAGLFGMKTMPLYLENRSIVAAMDTMVGVPGIGKKGKTEMIKRLDGQFNIDGVKSLNAKQVTYHKSKTERIWKVTADYEAKTVLVSNISVVIHFVKTVEIPR